MKSKKLTLALLIALNVCLVGALAYVVLRGFHIGGQNEPTFSQSAPPKQAASVGTVAAAETAAVVGKIPEGVTINGSPVGGMTKPEAVKALAEAFPERDADITAVLGDQTWRMLPADFAARYDFERAASIAAASQKGEKVTLPILYSETAINEKAELISEQAYVAPIDPTMAKDGDAFAITPGAFGRAADTDKLTRDIKRALEESLGGVSAHITVEALPVAPQTDEGSFALAQDLLGTFTTKFNATQTNRNQNIKTASGRINNRVVLPGEVFSTNKEFGETTYDNGYRMAGTYQNGKVVEGMGGGMCQVSSTLYVALLYAELEIVERTNHSMPVAYVDLSYDATLAGDYIDMKFRNSTDCPVLIETVMTGNTITVNVYGHETRPEGRELKFEKALISSTPPAAEIVTQDPSLPLDERVVDVAAKTGYQYRLYKLAYEGGQLVGKTQVNTSTYRPVRGEVRVGTGPAAPEIPAPPAEQPPAEPQGQPDDVYPSVIEPPSDEVEPIAN